MATQSPVGAQEMPLLRTKLYIPPPRREQVSRPRLIERLSAGLHRKLTLVSAPAGIGKTPKALALYLIARHTETAKPGAPADSAPLFVAPWSIPLCSKPQLTP